MKFKHESVLLNECIENLNIKPWGVYVDGTMGGAGHSIEILKCLDDKGLLIGIDQDNDAVAAAQEKLENIGSKAKFIIQHTNFENIRQILNVQKIKFVNGILLDLGVSSHQLDVGERGFSYRKDAPLDMRMDKRNPLNAQKIVNQWDAKKLVRIIREYGEEKWAKRIASFIVTERSIKPIQTTKQLSDIITRAIPAKARRTGPHPARRTFQAIRIAVNDELGVLERALKEMIQALVPGGRICVITFHSLEDRIVKKTFAQLARPCTCPPDFPQCICGKEPQLKIITTKPITPDNTEQLENPRARSAKLRVAERL